MRALVTDKELRRMRSQQARHLPGTLQVLRRTIVTTDMGEQRETWPSVATVACRLRSIPRLFPEGILGSQMTSTSTYTAVVPWNTSVLPTDRLSFEGRTFHVTRAYQVTNRTVLRVVVEEHD